MKKKKIVLMTVLSILFGVFIGSYCGRNRVYIPKGHYSIDSIKIDLEYIQQEERQTMDKYDEFIKSQEGKEYVESLKGDKE